MADSKPMVFKREEGTVYVCNGRSNLQTFDADGRIMDGLLVTVFRTDGRTEKRVYGRESRDCWRVHNLDNNQGCAVVHGSDAVFGWLCECEVSWPSFLPVFLLKEYETWYNENSCYYYCINTRRIAADSPAFGIVVREVLCPDWQVRPGPFGGDEAVYAPLPEGRWVRLVWDRNARDYKQCPSPQIVNETKLWGFLDRVWRDVTGESRFRPGSQQETLQKLALERSEAKAKILELRAELKRVSELFESLEACIGSVEV